jgi:TonB-linked SusC/RagA family outer membrane protein
MKKRIYVMLTMFLLGILLTGAMNAQGIRVSGKVTDAADGSALPGVTLLEKGTSNGTMTDSGGNFSLTVAPDATLLISYVGYLTQEVPVNNRSTINVSMAVDVQKLGEVVVIGYGTVAKKDATGSVVAIGTRDFNKGSVSSPQSLLVGKVAGVQITTNGGDPTQGATIRIRGGSSMSASNDPLIVIDGVPIDNGGVSGMPNPLNLINSNDIESFTVLKDASATAIFGSRASNGVIIITTKKGLAGRPMKVTYDGSVSIGTKTGQVDVLSPIEFRAQLYSRYAPTSAAALLMGKTDTDWQKQVYQTAVSLDHNLSVSGNVKNMPYRVSVGYTDQTGLLKTSGLERLTSALNFNPSFLDNHLTVNLNAKYMNVKNRFANWGAVGAAMSFDPTQQVYTPGGKYGGYYTWLQTNGDPITIATANPLSLLELRNDRSFVNRVLGNVQIDYKFHFLPELKATINAGGDFSKSDGKVIVPENAAWAYNKLDGGGSYNIYSQNKRNELLDMYLNYNKELPSISSRIDVTAGYSWQHFYSEGSYFSRNYSRTKTFTSIADGKYNTENYLVSFFGRINYIFKDKYLLTATVRQDGSSRFDKGNRWGLFPSVALAWNIKEEGFLQGVGSISAMKLRLGYGITGQQDVGNDYPYLARYTFSQVTAQYQFGNNFITTLRPEGYDKNLKWEETTTYNIGLDFGLFKDRITASVDAYYRPTKDLLNTIPVPAGTNLTNQILTNVGDLVNKGIEVTLNVKPIVNPEFEWSFGLNATINKNELKKLTAVDNPNYLGVFTGGIAGGVGNYIQIHTVGYPVSSFYVYEQVYGTDGRPVEGLYVDRNKDGKFSDLDKYRYKKPAPDLLLGFSSMFRYKNWDLNFNGRVSLGNYVYNNMSSGSSYAGIYNSVGYLNNLNRSILDTKFANPQYWSDYYMENGSFLRLDNLALGYNFENIGGSTGRLRVYSSVQNLFVITRYKGLDPEVGGGIDNNIFPRPRTIMLGASLEF